jgi:hypothetical protein
MGLADFEVYLQERLRAWDDTVDISAGSPIDTQVIQPVIRRLGTDPFTMDAAAFIYDRLAQEHPEIAVGVGDATADILINQALMLWDPIIREIKRVTAMLSFKDPYILNTAEAEALGANLFAERNKGKYSRGVVRIYFAQPQNFSLTQSNFSTSSSGLRYYPTKIQSIRREEMLVNSEGELYYFDANYIAESAGANYNIEQGAIVTVANVTAAVRVINKNRFRDGLDEDDAVAFVGKIARELTERSLVTLRGIIAKITSDLPEVTRIQVIGFNDPEMQRDIISGGGLGKILAFGVDGAGSPDGHFKTTTYRFNALSADFLALVGPPGPTNGFVVTIGGNAFLDPPVVRDVGITRVIDQNTVELAEQVVSRTASGCWWTLRKWELTLSGIPGGILFPDSPDGTVTIPSDQIHVGGCTDTYTRSSSFETGTLIVDVASDDQPLLLGLEADPTTPGTVQLLDLVLGTNYSIGDSTYLMLEDAAFYQHTLEILQGNNEGPYRILSATQMIGASPVLELEPSPPGTALSDTARWRLIDELDIDLVEPKETRVVASDGQTYQNVYTFTTLSGTDFNELGVSVGDVLRLESGRDVGDYRIESIVLPSYATVQVDRPFKFSSSGVKFRIFRANAGGGVKRPMVRITSIDLLDTAGQPVGVSIPYASPVDVEANAFSNAGRGVRVEVKEALVGLVTIAGSFAMPGMPGSSLVLQWENPLGVIVLLTVDMGVLGATPTAADVVAQINFVSVLNGYGVIAKEINNGWVSHCAIRPPGRHTRVDASSMLAVVQGLFGAFITLGDYPTAGSIRVPGYDWPSVRPTFSFDYDVVHIVDGVQPGYYDHPETHPNDVEVLTVDADLEPEVNRVVRVGSRSFGTVRAYFLAPTSFEVDQFTVFTAVNEDGLQLDFRPDPMLGFQMIPPLPSGTQPEDGAVPFATTFTSVSQDFIKAGVRGGDHLVVTFEKRAGTVALADPVVALAGTTLSLSIDDTPDKVVTFLGDTGTPGEVTRSGVANQINAWVGLQICDVVETPSGSGNYYLVFNYTKRVVVRSTSSANALLGFSVVNDSDNDAENKGTYLIFSVSGTDTLLIDTTAAPDFPSSFLAIGETDVQFQIVRPQAQRVSSSTMNDNTTFSGLYYFDVELVSLGMGDLFNLVKGQVLVVRDYRSDGYYLSTDNPTTSFSPVESINLHVSRSIVEVGADDSPVNATQISGQQLSVSYEYSASVQSNQNLQTAESSRVICQSPLARNLVPHFVRFDLTYRGGSKETVIQPLINSYINGVDPGDAVESSDLQQIVLSKGANSISNPIDLVAVVHDLDRTVYLHRSQDKLTTGRLAAFVPDVIKLTRATT